MIFLLNPIKNLYVLPLVLNYIEQISKFLVDPMEVAYGGRIDKALGGRSRDIG